MTGSSKDHAINNQLVLIKLIGHQIIHIIWEILFSLMEDSGNHTTTTCPPPSIHKKLLELEDPELKEVMKIGNQLNFAIVHALLNGTQITTMLELGKFTMLQLTKFGKPNGILRKVKFQEATLLGKKLLLFVAHQPQLVMQETPQLMIQAEPTEQAIKLFLEELYSFTAVKMDARESQVSELMVQI